MKMRTLPKGLILQNIELRLEGRSLVSVNAHISPGSVLTIMGESGSGKSSLLDFIAGFLSPDFEATGSIVLEGKELSSIPANLRQIGLMFQTPILFPHMSVIQNLLFAIPAQVRSKKKRLELAQTALREIGLTGFDTRDPFTLSGGQQTRVALMRTLLAQPKALLLDEPFSSLDKAKRAEIRALVFDKARDRDLPVLLVTHDEADAVAAQGDVLTLA